MIRNDENLVEKGDLVTRMIPSHYTDGRHSDAIGVVLSANFPLARVFFYDTKMNEVWNQKVLQKVKKGEP
jgi:hypothetical protein